MEESKQNKGEHCIICDQPLCCIVKDGAVHLVPGSERPIMNRDGKLTCIKCSNPEYGFNDSHAKSQTDFSQSNTKKSLYPTCAICHENPLNTYDEDNTDNEDNTDKVFGWMPCLHCLCSDCLKLNTEKFGEKCPVCRQNHYGLPKPLNQWKKPKLCQASMGSPLLLKERVSSAGMANLSQGAISSPSSDLSFNQGSLPFQPNAIPFNQGSLSVQGGFSFQGNHLSYGSWHITNPHLPSEYNHYNTYADALQAYTMQTPEDEERDAILSNDLNHPIDGDGTLLIAAITENSVTFNDLVAMAFIKNDDGNYNPQSIVNFIHKTYESNDFILLDSGDDLFSSDSHQMLKHFLVIDPKHSMSYKIHLVDEAIVGNQINSKSNNILLYNALKNYGEKVAATFNEQQISKPDSFVITAQVTYNESNTLKDLSPNVAPSSSIMVNGAGYTKTVDGEEKPVTRVYNVDRSQDHTNMSMTSIILMYNDN